MHLPSPGPMAAAVERPRSLTEGELLAARRHRLLRARSAAVPQAPASAPCASTMVKAPASASCASTMVKALASAPCASTMVKASACAPCAPVPATPKASACAPCAPDPATPKASACAPCAPAGRSDEEERRISRLDKYKHLKRIGEGAFGAVSKARDRRTGQLVAIKSLLDGGGDDESAALLREAALLAACAANPKVVALRDVARGMGTDCFHLVMDLDGVSLGQIISARQRHGLAFNESETRRAMAQLLAGVGSMHAHGIVHRDLKPANILVGDQDRKLKICDLGLSKSVAAPPLDVQPEGTVGYIAPEMLLCHKDCGEPLDMWALGCIMAELVTGQQLFLAENFYDQLVDIVIFLGVPDEVSLMPLGLDASAQSQLQHKMDGRLSPAGFNVLHGLLRYDPKERLTAAAALQMPWFEDSDD